MTISFGSLPRVLVALIAALLMSAALLLLVHSATAQTAFTDASTISYTGTHPAHSWTGTSTAVGGSLTFDPDAPNATAVTVRIEVETFDSGNPNRDSNMLDIVDIDRYPYVTFVSDSVAVTRWTATAGGHTGAWVAHGMLTFHGQTRALAIPLDVTHEDGTFSATASFEVSLETYRVKRPRLLGMRIKDALQFEAALFAETPAP